MKTTLNAIATELLALPGVVPPAGGCVLVVGKGLNLTFPPDVLIVERNWGEGVGELKHFDRVVILAGRNCPNEEEAVRQAQRLVRNDGMLVVVAARPAFWGVRGTVWWRGHGRRAWRALLKRHLWVVADEATIGFAGTFWKRLFPFAGAVWVVLAQKRVGGLRVADKTTMPNPLDVMKKAPMPGAVMK
jgi:hypothetical protein